ncbi:hypothetical protein CVU76_02515 [Candidatus Dojkabacteria bacterium HGW-Dojkabacteria-1]|uniref:Uncharacterized protein n=1 Tax=Candidatus Dojkabacteria bacterium HGW-Dojkabacteria-1 TaxID=2013761 RepID=A0A2N2F3S9_9BACT|nr:MAG: hypothetical protein CVU76_02515 [Candidatus Dojkabacteria bacterium HGW-Dojkabacteria-1]
MLKTSKFHIEAILFLPLIMLLWEPFSKKRSHWWNWSKYTKKIEKGVFVKAEKSNHPLTNVWHLIVQLNFKWKKLVIFEAENYQGEFQIVYGNREKEICSVILKGKVACLVPSSDTVFTAVKYPNGEELQLKIIGYTDKYRLDKGILFI